MAFRGDIEALVLATLQSGPKHGYEIVKHILELGERTLRLGEGQLYPVLHRLEAEGMVKSQWDVADGRAPRRVYELTEAGTASLAAHKTAWEQFSRAVGRVLDTPEVKRNGA
jgi:DNA-binding PadR family transcriptional regulator